MHSMCIRMFYAFHAMTGTPRSRRLRRQCFRQRVTARTARRLALEATQGDQRRVAHPMQSAELAQQVGVSDRIQFLGQRDPLPSLHAADAFVMNSLYEGQGISAIEALAAGLPAVLSDVDGLRNLKGMDVPAVWCGTDVDTLVDAIEEIRTRPPQGTTDIMLKSFSPHERVPALAARYRSVAA